MSDGRLRHFLPWLCCALAAVLAIGCSSDSFGPTGRNLPPEVTQDSLVVEIVIPSVLAQTLEPDGEISEYDERRTVVLGKRLRSVDPERSDWQATPMFRFDFSDNVQSLPVPAASTWKSVSLELKRYKDDQYYGADDSTTIPRFRDLALFTLSAALDSSMRSTDLNSLLDQSIVEYDNRGNDAPSFRFLGDGSAGSVDTLSALYAEFASWLDGGTHNGMALVDQSGAYDVALGESLMRFASDDFPRSSASLLELTSAQTIWQPNIRISYDDPDTEFDDIVSYRPVIDFTHVEREMSPESRIQLGTQPNHWAFLRFDIAAANIPSNATITQATLSLHVDEEYSLLRGSFAVRAVEADESAASGLTPAEIQDNAISRSLTAIPAEAREAEIDVTEYVQRYVNGLFGSGAATRGILLLQTSTNYDLVRSLEFFGNDAPADSLKPRLVVQFTPPPDFQE